jgi:hypothetical protein
MPIIPAPLQPTPAAGSLRFCDGAPVGCGGTALAPLAAQFCGDVARRCGIRVSWLVAPAAMARAEGPPCGTVICP